MTRPAPLAPTAPTPSDTRPQHHRRPGTQRHKGWRYWLLGLCLGHTLLTPCEAVLTAQDPPTESLCPPGNLVDPAFRDAATLTLRQLIVRAPKQPSHGAVRRALGAAHVDKKGRAWHHIAVYEGNLGMIGALRIDPTLRTEAGQWLRWQVEHLPLTGKDQGIVYDRWVLSDGHQESTCPPDIDPRHCQQIDATDSTLASIFLLAQAYWQNDGDLSLLKEPKVRQALDVAATTLASLQAPHGMTLAKREHPVAYLMDAAEVSAGWRALANLQEKVWRQPAAADISRVRARLIHRAMEQQLWDAPLGLWRISLEATSPQLQQWYPDTMAQAWPLLWSSDRHQDSFNLSKAAWKRASAQWRGQDKAWEKHNVDPAGFWWPAAAVAAHCSGDTQAATEWVARARSTWLRPQTPFPWPFQVSDLLWLLWLAEPGPPQAPLPP